MPSLLWEYDVKEEEPTYIHGGGGIKSTEMMADQVGENSMHGQKVPTVVTNG